MGLADARGSRIAASTAEGAAAIRAAGAIEPDAMLRGPDDLAIRFVGGGARLTALVRVPAARRLAPRVIERLLPGAYWFEIARVKHMDAVLRRELAAGARQLLVLGAGFDARAYRFAEQLAGVRTFELDHPETASLKRGRVRRIFGELPRHVTYVDLDLENGDLGRRMREAGWDDDLRSFVIWSGVTAYLDAGGVDAVIAWFAGAASGSSIVFDYAFREAVAGDDSFHGAAQLRRRVARGGEPLRFGIPRGGAAGFLAERGLELDSDVGPDELRRRYLVRGDGRLAGRPYGFVAIAHARSRGKAVAPRAR
jgi:methyltransferase (TIGR00027 family)